MLKAINIYQFKDIENMYSPLNELANFTYFFYGTSLNETQLNNKYHLEYFFTYENDDERYKSFINNFINYFKAKYKYSYYINEDKMKDLFNALMLKWYDLYLFKYLTLNDNMSKLLDGAKNIYTSSVSRGVDNKAYQNDTPQNQFNNDFLDEDFINQYQKSLTNEEGSTSSSNERQDNISERINDIMRSVKNLFDEMTERFHILFIDVQEINIIEVNN